MILTPKIAPRVVALCLLAVLLQVTFFSRISLLGGAPDVAVLVVIVLGLLGGSMIGAVAGFGVGLGIDALVAAPLGGTALAYILAGYLAGLYRERSRRPAGLLAIPVIGMVLALASQLAMMALQLMLGMSGPFSGLIARDMLLTALYAFLLALPVYHGIRVALRPALVGTAPFERSRDRSGASLLEI